MQLITTLLIMDRVAQCDITGRIYPVVYDTIFNTTFTYDVSLRSYVQLTTHTTYTTHTSYTQLQVIVANHYGVMSYYNNLIRSI